MCYSVYCITQLNNKNNNMKTLTDIHDCSKLISVVIAVVDPNVIAAGLNNKYVYSYSVYDEIESSCKKIKSLLRELEAGLYERSITDCVDNILRLVDALRNVVERFEDGRGWSLCDDIEYTKKLVSDNAERISLDIANIIKRSSYNTSEQE